MVCETRYINAGVASNANGRNSAVVYFYAKDSYGGRGMDLAQISPVANSNGVDSTGNTLNKTTTTAGSFTLDQYGQITNNNLQAGDYVTVTGITNSGLVQTIRIQFTNANGKY